MGEAEALTKSILHHIELGKLLEQGLHHVDNEWDENKKCFNNHQQYPIENGFQEHDKNLNKTVWTWGKWGESSFSLLV